MEASPDPAQASAAPTEAPPDGAQPAAGPSGDQGSGGAGEGEAPEVKRARHDGEAGGAAGESISLKIQFGKSRWAPWLLLLLAEGRRAPALPPAAAGRAQTATLALPWMAAA